MIKHFFLGEDQFSGIQLLSIVYYSLRRVKVYGLFSVHFGMFVVCLSWQKHPPLWQPKLLGQQNLRLWKLVVNNLPSGSLRVIVSETIPFSSKWILAMDETIVYWTLIQSIYCLLGNPVPALQSNWRWNCVFKRSFHFSIKPADSGWWETW